ncbi:MAG TPA: zinc metalloprotease HtpX [Candidatus Sulfopaludibacter sp.]|jgi:heat shock protein HtpX|nr:zinc metalloprotease HtpX [Candidatus Sulfopaludibacter sp.]
MNSVKTVLLLGLLSGLLVLGGGALMGQNGLYLGLGLAAVMNFTSYFFSDKIALASYSAQPVTQEENPEVYRRVAPIVQGLAQRMNIPMPKLYLIPDPSPNAFATGRNPQHASVAFTAGILQLMNDSEIEGVVAHELGHVLHRDILISSVAATIAGAITMLASMARWAMIFGGGRRDDREGGGSGLEMLAMMILAPLAAGLIQMAISRSREYDADAASAKYVGSPYPLINGLQKLETYSKRIPMDASPSTAHMFIIKPFTGQTFMRLFSTHPSTEDRIARLQAMR